MTRLTATSSAISLSLLVLSGSCTRILNVTSHAIHVTTDAVEKAVLHRRHPDPINKGTIRVSPEVNFLNAFSMRTPEGTYNSTGIIGLGLGADYFYKTNRYLSFSAGVATDRLPVDYFGSEFITGKAWYTSIQNNHVIGNFDLGYGLSFSGFHWTESINSARVNFEKSSYTAGLGLSLSAQYRVWKSLRIGVAYQPNLLGTNFSPAFNYEHYISLRVIWKLPLKW